MAFDGTRFLVAWSDARGSLIGGRDIYAAHVTRQGRSPRPADSSSTRNPVTRCFRSRRRRAEGQSVVTWTTGTAPGVFAARVNASGTVLDTTPIVLSTSVVEAHVLLPETGGRGRAERLPRGLVRVDCRSRPLRPHRAKRIDTTGQVGAPVVAAPGIWDSVTLAADYDGTQFVLAWNENGSTSAMRIDVNGALPDGVGGIPVSGLPVPYAMAFGGGRSLVVGDVSTLVAATLDTGARADSGPDRRRRPGGRRPVDPGGRVRWLGVSGDVVRPSRHERGHDGRPSG